MKKNAVISVKSEQPGVEDNPIEVVTPGSFYKEDEKFVAIYEETEISGMEGTTTTFSIDKDRFSLIRMGTTTTTMEFVKNNKKLTLYNTPYGVLEIEIDTKELQINVDEKGGNILINYNMSVSGQRVQKTTLKININAQ
jgi:uncharacterized beta-barrel protein YwiB (DUF1934 family)